MNHDDATPPSRVFTRCLARVRDVRIIAVMLEPERRQAEREAILLDLCAS